MATHARITYLTMVQVHISVMAPTMEIMGSMQLLNVAFAVVDQLLRLLTAQILMVVFLMLMDTLVQITQLMLEAHQRLSLVTPRTMVQVDLLQVMIAAIVEEEQLLA